MSALAPVIERVVALRFSKMDPEFFDSFRIAWKTYMESLGYQEEIINNWSAKLPVSEAGKMPDLSKTIVTLNKTHRFWNPDKTFCAQFFSDCLTFNLVSKSQTPGSYTQLKELAGKFFPQWSEITKVHITEVALQYINKFNKEHIAPFMNQANTIHLGDAFTVFSLPPPLGAQIQFPYRHDFTLDHSKNKISCYLTVNVVIGNLGPQDNSFNINLVAQHKPGKAWEGQSLWPVVDALHEEIIIAFKAILTPKMLEYCGVTL